MKLKNYNKDIRFKVRMRYVTISDQMSKTIDSEKVPEVKHRSHYNAANKIQTSAMISLQPKSMDTNQNFIFKQVTIESLTKTFKVSITFNFAIITSKTYKYKMLFKSNLFYNDYNQFFIATLMNKQDYRIILKYSQLTLQSLISPYYHVEKGCQFNYFELDQLIQNELEEDESKQLKCPVCHIQGQLKIDLACLVEEFQNEQNQIVNKMKDQQVIKTQKSSYFYSVLSQKKEVFELQQKFNSQLLISDNNKNELTLKFIENLNVQRNNEIFEIYSKLGQKQQPTLIGVINCKLILFYHGFKIKIELDLYDNTNKNYYIKLADLQYGHFIIKQVSLINNFIYLVVQYDKLYQLYTGNFDQIFDKNKNETIFYVSQMPGYTLLGISRLLQFKNQSLMIGNKASIIVKDQNDTQIMMDENLKIPTLNKNRQIVMDEKIQIPTVNKNAQLVMDDNIKIPLLNEGNQIAMVENINITFLNEINQIVKGENKKIPTLNKNRQIAMDEKIQIPLLNETNQSVMADNIKMLNESNQIAMVENINITFLNESNQVVKGENIKIPLLNENAQIVMDENKKIPSVNKNRQIVMDEKLQIQLLNESNQIVMDENIKIPLLNENTQFAPINDSSMLFVGKYETEKGVGFIKEFNILGSTLKETQQNTFNYPNSELDFSLLHGFTFYLLNSEKLNQSTIQVTQITTSKDRNSFTKMMTIKNHHSYLKVKIIPTTKSKVGNVSCALVGLMFQQSQTILPGVLVFNDRDNTIEIELI